MRHRHYSQILNSEIKDVHFNSLLWFLPAFKDANTRSLALFGGRGSFLFSHLFILLLFMLLLILYFCEGDGWGGMYLHSRHT